MPLQPRSPLHDLAVAGDVKALSAGIQSLAEQGEERVNLLTWVLVSAAEANQVAAAEVLLAAGASVDGGADPRPYIRPLWKAAKRGHLEMVRFLVERGANPELGDGDGMRPMEYAHRCGRTEVVRYLQRLAENGG